LVYDSENDLIILFGGYTHLLTTEIDHETWAFDYNSNTWTQLNPVGNLHRRWQSMAYDSESGKIILFGGNTGDDVYNFRNDTWVFDYNFNNWTMMLFPEIPDDNGNGVDDTSILFVASLFGIISVILIRRKRK